MARKRVNKHVSAQITISTKFLATLAAVERLDVGVSEQMCLEV